MTDSHAPQPAQERTGWRRLVGPLLVVSFALSGFAVGMGFIFIGSLEVSDRFDVYGYPTVIPGQPHVFRGWAFTDNPPGPLRGAELEVAIDNRDVRASGTVGEDGSVVLELDVPADIEGQRLALSASLEIDGDVVETVPFELEVARTRVADEPAVAVRNLDAENPVRIDLLPPRGVVVPYVQNPVYVRVTDPITMAPRPGVRVAFELKHGNLDHDVPRAVTTDLFGLAAISIVPLDETDWDLVATLPDGSQHTSRRTLYSQPLNLRIQPARRLIRPQGKLQFTLHTISSHDTVFMDLLARGAWLATGKRGFSGDGAMVSWAPGLSPPEQPEVVTLIACYSDASCGDTNAIEHMVWSKDNLGPRALARVMGDHARSRGAAPEYVDHTLKLLDGDPPRAAVEQLVDFLAGRIQVTYSPPIALLRSEPGTEKRLAEVKEDVRGWLNLLAVLLVLSGALLIVIFAMRTAAPRRQAMQAVVLEDDDLLELQTEISSSRQKLLHVLEIAALALTIIVFVGGMVVLLGQL